MGWAPPKPIPEALKAARSGNTIFADNRERINKAAIEWQKEKLQRIRSQKKPKLPKYKKPKSKVA